MLGGAHVQSQHLGRLKQVSLGPTVRPCLKENRKLKPKTQLKLTSKRCDIVPVVDPGSLEGQASWATVDPGWLPSDSDSCSYSCPVEGLSKGPVPAGPVPAAFSAARDRMPAGSDFRVGARSLGSLCSPVDSFALGAR